MAKTQAEKVRPSKRINKKKRKLNDKNKNKKKKKKQQPQPPQNDPALLSSPSDDEDEDDDAAASSPERLQRLIEPHTKDQLISILIDAAAADPAILSRIKEAADVDVSQRKLFVHGLGWDATREQLLSAFLPSGPVEDCNVVTDKATGRAKGYGFVLFRTRSAAQKALRVPQRKIGNRMTSCQLASVGPVPSGDLAARKIYVSNVPLEASPDKLRALFVVFGELEAGPTGFDALTGKSRGFAVFVYKTAEGARRCLEEPHKMFDGHQLHCQLATDPSQQQQQQRGKVPTLANTGPAPTGVAGAPPPLLGAAPQPVLAAAAAAAAQTFALLGQNPAAYSALLGQNPLLAAAAAASLNPNFSALNPAAAGLAQAYGSGGVPSLLGAYGAQGTTGLQGWQSQQGSHIGQASSSGGAVPAAKPGGLLREFPSYFR